jgi:hypothetical protein
MDDNNIPDRDANRDPITGAPGSHPIGTGVGAVAVVPWPARPRARSPARWAP